MKPQHLRFHEIDLLRGVACLSVLAFHYLSRGPATQSMQGVDYPLLGSMARYGYLGVHLFFMISGFVILMSAQGATPRGFLASRAGRLYPALWAGATLTAGTAWLLQDAHFGVALNDYLINLTMFAHWFDVPYVDGAYWSLAYEMHFYIFVWLALRCGLMSRLQWLLTAWLLISAVNAARPMWPVEFWLNAKWAPFFVAGGVFYLIRIHGITRARLGLLAASFVLALIYALFEGNRHEPAAEYALVPMLVIAIAVAGMFLVFSLIAAGRFRMRASPLTYYAGVLTYPVYIIHQNFGFMIFEALRKASDSASTAMALMVAAVFGISWAIHVLIERPLGQLLRRGLDRQYSAKLHSSVAES